MLLAAGLALFLQPQARVVQRSDRPAALRTVTAEQLATAFKNAHARDLLTRARAARFAQDSALASYEATAYQRISASLAFTSLARPRLVFRNEQVGRVQWHRDVGVWLRLEGARTVLPGVPDVGEREARKGLARSSAEMVPIPYYPGSEPLWAGQTFGSDVENEGPVHPLGPGAEAYYTYAAGDSVSFRFPNGRVVQLRELQVRPRESSWRLIVGSLWFDDASHQLVRAAYRFAVPMRIDEFVLEQDPTAFDDVPAWLKPVMFPIKGEISAVVIEYGMYGGRFWLPRLRSAEGVGEASFVKVPFRMDQTFTYESVNALASLPPLPPSNRVQVPDSLRGPAATAFWDSVMAVRRAAARARRDSVRAGWLPARPVQPCDTGQYWVRTERRGDGAVNVATVTPCDAAKLETSPLLPKSIYDSGDELFDVHARDALIEQALSMGVQPPLAITPATLARPRFDYGLHELRYNRVEGLSPGLVMTEDLGAGYELALGGRIGTGDRFPRVEAALTRSNLMNTVYLSGYDALAVVGDWGNPLSFGSSASALLFGRDEGFYYRAQGVALGGRRDHGLPFDWRFFAERQRTAAVASSFGVFSRNSLPNVLADSGATFGLSLRAKSEFGQNPRGTRLLTDVRGEIARGDSVYGRAAADLTLTQGVGSATAGLTLSGGNSFGPLTPQRRWYLGGTHTVRGQFPDTAVSGNAFWLARAELGYPVQGVRPAVFTDFGWVGDRSHFSAAGHRLSGAGAGVSILDGLIRFDLSRGLRPGKDWRFDAYLEAVF